MATMEVARVHIVGTYTGSSSVFSVNIGGHLIVTEVIGTGEMSTISDGVYLTSGGVTAITGSTGLTWTFTEVR